MKLIKLNLDDVRPVWVNPKSVCSVTGSRKGIITFITTDNDYITVSETPEEVVKLLEECE